MLCQIGGGVGWVGESPRDETPSKLCSVLALPTTARASDNAAGLSRGK